MTKKQKQEKGITLIALIITIIILLILAGITISAITSSGLFGKAKQAEINVYHATVKERIILGGNEYQIDKIADNYTGNIINYLTDESYIATVDSESYYRVQVEEVAKNVKTGKGATKTAGDIYVIENNTSVQTTGSTVKIASAVTSEIETSIKVAATTTIGSSKEYVLRYYDKTGQYIDLLYLGADGSIEDPNPELGKEDGNEDEDEDVVVEPEIPTYPTTKEISYIEDLIDIAMDVNNGTNDYTEQTIELKRDLDFTNKEHYRDPDHYYSYNNNQTDYYSLDSLAKVTTSGGTDESAADTTNDPYTTSASIYQELNYNSSYSSAPGFTQIGDSSEKSFKGVFNGNGYTINNLYMSSYKIYNNSTSSQVARTLVGMFGYNEGYISNLTLNNISLYMYRQIDVGILTGENKNVIKDCTVGTITIRNAPPNGYGTMSVVNTGTIYNANVTGTFTASVPANTFGGITATNQGTIENCNVTANYTFNSVQTSMALIASNNSENAKIKNCVLGDEESEYSIANVYNSAGAVVNNMGTISDTTNYYNFNVLGTFAGIVNNNYGTINNCNNYGNITSESASPISGVAIIQSTTSNYEIAEINISNCNNYGNVNTSSGNAAGILASSDITIVSNEIKILNCTNSGNITASGCAAGIFRTYYITSEQIDITNCTNTGAVSANGGSSGILQVEAFTNSGVLNITSCTNSGTLGTNTNMAGILATNSNNSNKGISEVNISKCNNSGEMSGSYPGGIANQIVCDTLRIKDCTNTGNITTPSAGWTAGIVARIINCSIMEIIGCTNEGVITSDTYTSGICGAIWNSPAGATNTITNCTNNGTINGGQFASGILSDFGDNGTLNISGCINNANIVGKTRYTAGILALAKTEGSGTISNCKNTGVINENSTSSYWTGGIVGSATGISISNCVNENNISAYEYAGGIAGELINGNIDNCINKGVITGSDQYIAGICGYGTVQYITNCQNMNNVSGGMYVGGIAATKSNTKPNFINCSNTGNISGGSYGYVAGIAAYDATSVINCYTTGTITTTSQYWYGAFIGNPSTSDVLTNCYYLTGSTDHVLGGEGLISSLPDTSSCRAMSESEMKAQSFVDLLNTYRGTYREWTLDSSTVNRGYPVFK